MFGEEVETGPFARNNDGTAKDPAAFQDALKSDAQKLQMVEQVRQSTGTRPPSGSPRTKLTR